MFCEKCGAQLADDDKFCGKCECDIITESTQEIDKRAFKRKMIKSMVCVGYIIVFCFIGAGFIFGNGYNVYDNGRAAAVHSPWGWKQKYGDQLEEMFDGCIHKYEGWYGLSWKNTYSLYQYIDITKETFESMCSPDFGYPKNYTSWSDSKYVNYISDYSVYRSSKRDYVFITIKDEILFVNFGTTNAEDDYEGVIPKIIIICVMLLFLPISCYIVCKVIRKKRCKFLSND